MNGILESKWISDYGIATEHVPRAEKGETNKKQETRGCRLEFVDRRLQYFV